MDDAKITSSTLIDKPENQQQLEFDQAASNSPVTPHNASYADDVRELTVYWYLPRKLALTDNITNTDFIILNSASKT